MINYYPHQLIELRNEKNEYKDKKREEFKKKYDQILEFLNKEELKTLIGLGLMDLLLSTQISYKEKYLISFMITKCAHLIIDNYSFERKIHNLDLMEISFFDLPCEEKHYIEDIKSYFNYEISYRLNIKSNFLYGYYSKEGLTDKVIKIIDEIFYYPKELNPILKEFGSKYIIADFEEVT